MDTKKDTVKVIVISDVHLEKSEAGKKILLLDSLNNEIQKIKDSGFYPVVVMAGDIAQGLNAYPMFEEIKTEVVYVAGNHEFWDGDYFRVNEDLINKAPANVHYLFNDFVVIKNVLFAGSTMWTDVGLNTNKDISDHCAFTMRDVSKITAEKWYENSKNVERLLAFYDNKNDENPMISSVLQRKGWNILIEREENKKTVDFFNALATCLELKLSNENLNSVLKDKFSSYFAYTFAKAGNEVLLKELWKKLEKVNCRNLKIVAVTHHLPFFEEMSVSSYTKNSEIAKRIPPLMNQVNGAWLNISSGFNYDMPHLPNYFFTIARGDVTRQENIALIFHYYNNGVKQFIPTVSKVFKNWIHGHDHFLAFTDFVKGVKICTSPMGTSSGVVYNDEGIDLKRIPVSNREVYTENLKKSFYTILSPESETPINLIKEWCWYILHKKNLSREIDSFEKIQKRKTLLMKKMWNTYQLNKVLKDTDIFNLLIFQNAQDKALINIVKSLDELQEAILLRRKSDYSYGGASIVRNNSNGYADLPIKLEGFYGSEDLLNFNKNQILSIESIEFIKNNDSPFLTLKEIFRAGLSSDMQNLNAIKYLKVLIEYSNEKYNDIEVYSFESFENIYVEKLNLKLNSAEINMKRKLKKLSAKIYSNMNMSNIDRILNRNKIKKNIVVKNLVTDFFN